MVTCSRCTHLPGKDGQQKELTRLGLYRCSKDKPWVFRSPFSNRECDKYTEVSEKDLPARLAFEAKAKQ